MSITDTVLGDLHDRAPAISGEENWNARLGEEV